MTRFLLALALLSAFVPAVLPLQQAGNATPAQPTNATAQPGNATPSGADPAAATFTSPAGLLLVAVKPDKVADYEAVIRALQEQLAASTDDRHRAIARSWRVYKGAELDAKANAIYIHMIEPVLPNVDYRPSLLLDELLAGASGELLGKYRDAIAAPPNKVGLTEFADMSVAPPPKKPANASPDQPPPAKKPGTPHH